jgi:hypothetical protein
MSTIRKCRKRLLFAVSSAGIFSLIFVSGRSTLLRRLTQRRFLGAKDAFAGISDLFGNSWSPVL